MSKEFEVRFRDGKTHVIQIFFSLFLLKRKVLLTSSIKNLNTESLIALCDKLLLKSVNFSLFMVKTTDVRLAFMIHNLNTY